MTIQKPIGAAPSKKARNRKGRKPQPVTISAIPWDIGATGPANRVAMVIEDRPFVDETGKRTNPNGIKASRATAIALLQRIIDHRITHRKPRGKK